MKKKRRIHSSYVDKNFNPIYEEDFFYINHKEEKLKFQLIFDCINWRHKLVGPDDLIILDMRVLRKLKVVRNINNLSNKEFSNILSKIIQ